MPDTLSDKIKELCNDVLGTRNASEALKQGNLLLVPAYPRWAAKWRFLAYRFRRKVDELLPQNERPAHDHRVLEQSEIDALSDLSQKLRAALGPIEEAYAQATGYNPSKRLTITDAETRLRRGRFAAVLNRTIFVWDILWGLAATREEIVNYQGDLVITPPNYSPGNEFLELVERRLRKMECMRYHVPGSNFSVPSMEYFAYPDNGGRVGGVSYDPGTRTNDDWEVQASSRYNFDLEASDVLDAISRLFIVPTVNNRVLEEFKTLNYCDKVIHILHLEEVAAYINRSGRIGETPDKKDIKIIAGMTYGTGAENNTLVGTGLIDDKFFERKSVRLDELVPGDQFVLRNHPIYQAFAASGSAWRLENAIVTRIRGTKIPSDIEVEGHGLGPYMFGDMQADLLEETRTSIIAAQRKLQTSSALVDAVTKRTNQENHTYWFEATVEGESYQGPIEFMNEDVDRPETERLLQEIDLDSQLSNPQRDELKNKILLDAFAARCLSGPPMGLLDPLFPKKYTEQFYVNPGNPQMKDIYISSGYWQLPFVKNITVLVGNKTLRIEGTDLYREKVRGVYFVAYPRYHVETLMDPSGRNITGYNTQPSSSAMITRLGKWTDPVNSDEIYEIVGDDELTFEPSGKLLEVKLPDSFGPSELWRPVLRVSMFDTSDPSLEKFFPGVDLTGKSVDWFETQDETNNRKLKRLKDGIAALQFDIRAELAFLWPYGGADTELKLISELDSNPPGEIYFNVEGHGRFNVVLFPLFRRRTVAGASLMDRIKISRVNVRHLKTFMADQITNFYNVHSPEGITTVIRPKLMP